jgi:Zn-finger nucleic acid-binding protein
MKCPNCSQELKMTDRQGIEIDYCPQCRGVWLDRGELDKIIERSAAASFQGRGKDDERHESFEERGEYGRYRPAGERGHYDEHYKRRKRKSFLGDLFDFD